MREGLDDGRAARRLVLGRAPGPVLHLLDLGATIHRLEVTGGDGVRRNVALGHPTAQDYLDGSGFLGGTVGRYANRIAGGRFELDGEAVQVAPSDRGNTLHGGPDGFHRRTWTVLEHDDDHAVLALVSPAGDQGFPGRLSAQARFEVTPDEVRLDLSATTDAPTVVNLTSHLYLNLDGEGAGTVDDHLLTVHAARWLPVDATGIPLGEPVGVDGTAFDLREPRRLGDVVRAGHDQLRDAGGLDHHLVTDGTGLRPVARLVSPRGALAVELSTDQPGVQVYTANAFDGTAPSTSGGRHRQGDGIALEPQHAPDSPNHPSGPDHPSTVLRPGEVYRSAIRWRFGEP